jgi:hypothetical protein
MTATNVRVCPSCGVAAGDADTCEGCGLELARLAELPTRADWEARAAAAPRTTPEIRPLLHPAERSRLALAIVALIIGLGTVAAAVIASVKTTVVAQLLSGILFLVVLLWFGQQVNRARLLGRAVKVGPDTMPALNRLIEEVSDTLDYHKRVDVYVAAKVRGGPIAMASYLGTRILLIEGGVVAELLKPGRSAQLTFLIGRSIGAMRAKHARLDVLVALLAFVDALKYVSLFLRPWYRATVYSGDQIGMVCCSDLDAALEATRRLLVGGDLAAQLQAGMVLPQACLVQRRLLPRLAQLTDVEPHVTNRYANLICFARYHDPVLWERLRQSVNPEHAQALEQLWERSPYRRRVAAGFSPVR